MVGTGKGAEAGILFRDAEALERLGAVRAVVLDKTGTITEGRPTVTDVVRLPDAPSEDELLALAAAVERGSEHPLADAIVREAVETRGLTIPTAEAFEASPARVSSAWSTAAGFSSVARDHLAADGSLGALDGGRRRAHRSRQDDGVRGRRRPAGGRSRRSPTRQSGRGARPSPACVASGSTCRC